MRRVFLCTAKRCATSFQSIDASLRAITTTNTIKYKPKAFFLSDLNLKESREAKDAI